MLNGMNIACAGLRIATSSQQGQRPEPDIRKPPQTPCGAHGGCASGCHPSLPDSPIFGSTADQVNPARSVHGVPDDPGGDTPENAYAGRYASSDPEADSTTHTASSGRQRVSPIRARELVRRRSWAICGSKFVSMGRSALFGPGLCRDTLRHRHRSRLLPVPYRGAGRETDRPVARGVC